MKFEVTGKLIKQIDEMRYLAVDNTWRYRSILRFFYSQSEKMKNWLYQEEVFEALKEYQEFASYTLEQCKQDLDTLLTWKNLSAYQDTAKVTTVEEFKNKKFRYQMTPYSVEIERLTIRLENLSVESASLEPTLLERLREELKKLPQVARLSEKEAGNWWSGVNNDFKRLNQNYQDYIRDLYSIKAEEMMKTKAFMVFKDRFIEYLRDFVKGLQNHANAYDELVKLLVQLRSPKLSKDFKPTVIYEIMENSLQPLSEDDLRPMSEAIENMDNIKSRLGVLKECKGAADRIRHAFDRYNQFIVVDKARHYEQAYQQLAEQKKRQEKLGREIQTTTIEIEKLEHVINDLAIQLETQQQKKQQLEDHDSVKIREKIIKMEEEITEKKRQRLEKDQHHETKRQQERELDNQISSYRQEVAAGEQSIYRQLTEMDELAEAFAFDEHAFTRDEITKTLTVAYDFTYINNTLSAHTQTITQAIKAMEKEKQMAESYEKLLLELEMLKKEQQQKERLLEQANRQLMEIQEESVEKLHLNNQKNREYIIPAEGLSQLAREIRQFGPDDNANNITRILQQQYHHQEAVKQEQFYREQSQWTQIEEEKKSKQAEIEAWQKIKDPEPLRAEKVIENRKKLVELGIPHLPLYKALDFVGGIDEKVQAAIEEALVDMGILDALILPANQREKLLAIPELSGDHYLFPEPQFMVHSINQYLKVDEAPVGISKEEIANVLNSILIDHTHHTHMDEKGNYRLGILWGRATGNVTARFIGASARKKYREEKLHSLEAELSAITTRLAAKTQILDQISNDEREVLRSLFKKNYLQKSASFPVEKFISSFETTRYRGIDFEAVLSCYFGEKLSWKKNLRSQYADEKSQYFRQIITVFNDSPAALWLEDILGNKNNAYALLNLKYNEDPEHLKRLLRQVCNGLNRSVAESEKVRLALFASQITKDPHAFDMNRDGGRLLLYALAAYYKLDYPKNAEAQMELLYQAGLIYDEVSNYTICRGIRAFVGDKTHSGWAGFSEVGEPLHISLWNISKIDRVSCFKKRIFVFENPTVFSEIAGFLEDRPGSLMCSAGNVKVATLLLLDKIVEGGGEIYYSGDFDPEGLLIADKLKKRYGSKLILWHFTPEAYQKIQSKKMISPGRLKKLDKIESPELIMLAEALKKSGYSGYQEMMVAVYHGDIETL